MCFSQSRSLYWSKYKQKAARQRGILKLTSDGVFMNTKQRVRLILSVGDPRPAKYGQSCRFVTGAHYKSWQQDAECPMWVLQASWSNSTFWTISYVVSTLNRTLFGQLLTSKQKPCPQSLFQSKLGGKTSDNPSLTRNKLNTEFEWNNDKILFPLCFCYRSSDWFAERRICCPLSPRLSKYDPNRIFDPSHDLFYIIFQPRVFPSIRIYLCN